MREVAGKSETPEGYRGVEFGPKTLSIPKDWAVKRFGDVFSRRSESITPKEGETVRYVGLKHLNSGELEIAGYDEDGQERSSSRRFEQGDVLFGKLRPNLEKAAIAPFEGVCSSDIIPIYSEDESLHEYLPYLMHSKLVRDRVVSTMEGTNLPRTSWDDLASMRVPVPPETERSCIASVLSTVDEQIQETDSAIDKTRELNRGLSQNLLFEGIGHSSYQTVQAGPKTFEIPEEWTVSTVGGITSRLRNGIAEKQNHDGVGIPVTRIETIAEGFVDRDSIGWMDLDPDDYEEFRLQKGDILFSHKNSLEHLGKTAQYWSEETLFHGENLLLLRPDESVINPRFAYFFLNGETTRQICRSFAKKSVSQVSLNQKEVSALPIPLPPMEEQDRIVEILDKGEKVLHEERATKEALQGLKRGLMQDLLTGKRRVETDD